MATEKVLIAVAAISTVAIPLSSWADTYQFFVSGYPAANERYATASPGMSLKTVTRVKKPTAADSLEARYRTWHESNSTALRSDKAGMTIVVK